MGMHMSLPAAEAEAKRLADIAARANASHDDKQRANAARDYADRIRNAGNQNKETT